MRAYAMRCAFACSLFLLAGCKAAVSPAAECRARESPRPDPAVVAIAEGADDAEGEHDEAARTKEAREAFAREWIRTHVYVPREEAIALAVRFLEAQGFTTAPPRGPLRRDIMESEGEADVRASRRGSIDPAPVGAMKTMGWWRVAFRRVGGDPCRVRVVAVSADGSRQRMIHQDLSLSAFE